MLSIDFASKPELMGYFAANMELILRKVKRKIMFLTINFINRK